MKKLYLLVIITVLVSSGCIANKENNIDDAKKTEVESSQYIDDYNVVIDKYNITIKESIDASETFYYKTDSYHYGKTYELILESARRKTVIDYCNEAVRYSQKKLGNPCSELNALLKQKF